MDRRCHAVMRLPLWLLIAVAPAGIAGPISVEPDDYSAGTDIRTVVAEVALSVTGEPEVEVQSLNGFSAFLGSNIATTGERVFGQFPGDGPIIPPFDADNAITWSDPHGLLRADFLYPAISVQIDLIFDDDDTMGLWAYDAAGNLLDSVIASGDGRGAVPFATASITRPSPDIAYVIAGGVGSEGGLLDNLIVDLGIVDVVLDVKPGAFPNRVHPGSRGVIPVAVLTTDSTDNAEVFDATTIDPSAVLFGATGQEASPSSFAVEDVDGDGDSDMSLRFDTRDSGIGCGDQEVRISGFTVDGRRFEGVDAIVTVGCGRGAGA